MREACLRCSYLVLHLRSTSQHPYSLLHLLHFPTSQCCPLTLRSKKTITVSSFNMQEHQILAPGKDTQGKEGIEIQRSNRKHKENRHQHEPRTGPPPPTAPPLPPPGALDALSLSSSLDSGLRTPQCQICFQGPEQEKEKLMSSLQLPSLISLVLAISTKNLLQWQAISLMVIEKVQIAAIVLGSLFLVASISWLIWSALSLSTKWQWEDLLFQICYGMYGFMDVVCIGLIVHEGSSVY
ncbi:E3 ubiquitin-protein ligase MARCH4 [Heterocephalus glaber]|uniref:E3 ubiquitin-protein ligase MARCH4 n=1 Tax=Heterocephalus glaber TaxID=10181 RepID=G5BEN6_HETGA|nr:E3 ubiquitin-protein ligase MARCH4 [Heterocephalus glaber]